MFFGARHRVDKYCDQLEAAADPAAFEQAAMGLWTAAQKASPHDVTAALERCAWLLSGLSVGAGGRFSILCGSLVELGAHPDPLVVPVADGLLRSLEQAWRFRDAWHWASGGQKLPDPEAADDHLQGAVMRLAPLMGGEAAYRAAEGWFSVTNWARPAGTLLREAPERWLRHPGRPAIVAHVAALVGDVPDLDDVHRLLGGPGGARR
ncbi:hypothetical protein ACFQY4_25450 [Catellatospora bangladeshensis]|uniref:Uncharacterized protein n=1 Tax=Catellatospora bangladeshensis TaxID=310355 RepID=A0A8J3JPJ8_9ACTN|nr:hypothetical protein [Catellatospora bangladeshensis]GIF81574.1 hypothetical protein Cba03nite_29230 [Catellatospora bangladeshensis]